MRNLQIEIQWSIVYHIFAPNWTKHSWTKQFLEETKGYYTMFPPSLDKNKSFFPVLIKCRHFSEFIKPPLFKCVFIQKQHNTFNGRRQFLNAEY